MRMSGAKMATRMPVRRVESTREIERAGKAALVVFAGKRLADVFQGGIDTAPTEGDRFDLDVRAGHAPGDDAELGRTVLVRAVVEEQVVGSFDAEA